MRTVSTWFYKKFDKTSKKVDFSRVRFKNLKISVSSEKHGGMAQKDVDYLMWKLSTGQLKAGHALSSSNTEEMSKSK